MNVESSRANPEIIYISIMTCPCHPYYPDMQQRGRGLVDANADRRKRALCQKKVSPYYFQVHIVVRIAILYRTAIAAVATNLVEH